MDRAACDRLHNTKGGDSDTELNELAVKPTRVPSGSSAVTMVTPVANMPRAVRNSALEKPGDIALREKVGWDIGGIYPNFHTPGEDNLMLTACWTNLKSRNVLVQLPIIHFRFYFYSY